MAFNSGEVLNAADLNDLNIDTLTTTGNVGIGTTSPQKHLDIQDAGTVEARLLSTDGGDCALLFGDNTDSVRASVFYDMSADRLHFRGYNNQDRMVINQYGRVGIGTISPVTDLVNIGDSSNNGSFRVHAAQGAESFRVSGDVLRSANINNLTTSSAANVYISPGNSTMYRSTSSIKYKTNVETMGDEYADAILELRPVWYRSLGQDDPPSFGYWGFIAEEVAEVDPRLVTFGVPDDYVHEYDDDGEMVDPAVEDLTEPEGVQYDRMVPHLVNLLQRHESRISELEQRIAELEAA